MRSSILACAVAAALPVAVAGGTLISAPASAQEFVRIATAGSGGNYYRLGGGLASIWNDEVENVQATIQATGGSVENLDLLADQEVEIAYLAGSVGKQAYDTEGVFAERPEDRYPGRRLAVHELRPRRSGAAREVRLGMVRDLDECAR